MDTELFIAQAVLELVLVTLLPQSWDDRCVLVNLFSFFRYRPSQILGRNPFGTKNPKTFVPRSSQLVGKWYKSLKTELNLVSVSLPHQQLDFYKNSQKGEFLMHKTEKGWFLYLIGLSVD